SGVFRPYAGVSTAIMIFTKTESGGTDNVWFYDMEADGLSLDDKRTELLPSEKQGPVPGEALTEGEHAKNNLPDILARWGALEAEAERPRTAQSFMVPLADIQATGTWDLSLNRYKEVLQEEIRHRPPDEIIAELRCMEIEIMRGLKQLKGMLG
ncbi:MAG: DNA methyltransferase, partial [Hyphomicrobiaceae bacterium]